MNLMNEQSGIVVDSNIARVTNIRNEDCLHYLVVAVPQKPYGTHI